MKKNQPQFIAYLQLCVISFLCFSALTHAGNKYKPGSGVREFEYTRNGETKTMNIYYHIPENNSSKTNVLFVMHGVKRNAEEYRDTWVKHSESSGVIIVTPEFSEENFPEGRSYQRGNIIDAEGHFTDKKEWTYSLIDEIFEFLQKKFKLKKKSYAIYGHSAGAQFVHRMILFYPEAKCHLAVAANAGYYCMPDFSVKYIYGLKNAPTTEFGLKLSFKKKLIIMLGTADIDENHEFLNKDPEAMAQGKHRFERGLTFYDTAKKTAKEMKTKLKWKVHKAKDIGHSNSGMARELLRVLTKYN